MFRVLRRQCLPVSQFEVLKIKAGCDRASNQGEFPFIGDYGSKPAARAYYRKERLAFFRIGAKPVRYHAPIVRDLVNQQRIARVEVPAFVGRDPMKSRKLSLLQ